MSRKKKKKFEEMKSFPNVLQWDDENVKEKVKEIINQYDKVILELACGKGEYSLHLGNKYSDILIIGIDIQGERIWKGAKDALEKKLDNVYFLRIQIQNIEEYISENSIDEIWITFPDPFLRERDIKRRLTSPNFLDIYKKILKKNGVIHLKTDSDELYEYTLETINSMKLNILKNISDIYPFGDIENVTDVQTTFEKKHLENGKKIKYLEFNFHIIFS
jgi:tRNA (guanine-N7-)-methyltransferase